MTDDVERAMQQPQGSFFMDDAKGFQAISAKALMKVLEKYENLTAFLKLKISPMASLVVVMHKTMLKYQPI